MAAPEHSERFATGWEQHAADTIREGYWLNDPTAVEILAREAPKAVEELIRWRFHATRARRLVRGRRVRLGRSRR